MTFTPMIIERGHTAHGGHHPGHHDHPVAPSIDHMPASGNIHGHDLFGGPVFVNIADLTQGPLGVVPHLGPICHSVHSVMDNPPAPHFQHDTGFQIPPPFVDRD